MKEVEEFYSPKKRLSATWNSLRVKLACQERIHAKGFSKKSASEIKTPVTTVDELFWTIWQEVPLLCSTVCNQLHSVIIE